ncbi:MAG: hypothetical protein WDA71_12115 [Actinomycetota bacterium]
MSESPDLREVQKRTLRLMNCKDGLWDLLLGLIFMALAVYPITRARLGPVWDLALFVGVLLLSLAAFGGVRRKISAPRLGYVESKRSPAMS